MLVTTAVIIIAGVFLFYLFAKMPFLKEIITIMEDDGVLANGSHEILYGFITGIIGIVLGFWLESVFIARLRILKKFCGLRCCLIDQIRYVLHKIVVSKVNVVINLYAIENIVNSPDSQSVLYSLPRYIKLHRHYGEYGEKFFDAARALSDYNKAEIKGENEKTKAVKKCLEFMLAIDNKLYKQIIGGFKELKVLGDLNQDFFSCEKKINLKNIKKKLCSNSKIVTRNQFVKCLIEDLDNSKFESKYLKAYCILTDK